MMVKYLIILVIAIAAFFAAKSVWKTTKSGGCVGCGGGCNGSCHHANPQDQEKKLPPCCQPKKETHLKLSK